MAEYNEKSKANKEGVIAPDGYHYMPDGTLMVDSEHEIQRPAPLSSKRQAFLNKARLGSSGGGNCIVAWVGGGNNKIKWKNLSNPTPTTFTT